MINFNKRLCNGEKKLWYNGIIGKGEGNSFSSLFNLIHGKSTADRSCFCCTRKGDNMDIIYKNLNEIKEYENNPRRNAVAVDKVAESIRQFGFKVPLVLDKHCVIVAGHARYKAAKQLGLDKVPCLVADDLSDEQVRAFRLADNKTAEFSEWDEELLLNELTGIFNIDMTMLGFDLSAEAAATEPHEDNFDIDKALEDITKPVTQIGDVWQLGEHRLVCGDCAEAAVYKKLLQGNKVDLVVTDPPYNIGYCGAGGTSKLQREQKKIANDNMAEEDFNLFLFTVNCYLSEHLKNNASFYMFYKERGHGTFLDALQGSGLTFKQELIWVKNQIVLGGAKYQNMYEPIIFGCKGKKVGTWNGGRKERSVIEDVDLMNESELRDIVKQLTNEMDFDVLRERKQVRNDLHPTMKPIRLLARLINNSSNEQDIVLDAFAGSGSTLIACEQTVRRGFMIELDRKYCDIIVQRWERFTGAKAVKI